MTNKENSLSFIYFKGIVIATVGVIIFSFDALLIRLAGVSGFKAGFWRAGFTAISLGVVFFFLNKAKAIEILKKDYKPIIIAGILWGLSGLGFTLGVMTAGASNALVMLSISPLFSAAFSFIIYRRIPSWITLLATVGAIWGIWFMYHNELETLNWVGLMFSLSTPFFAGINLSFMRTHKEVSRIAIGMAGGVAGMIFSLVGSVGSVAISFSSILPLAILGLFAIPIGQTMISTGTRYIPAAESALIKSLETVFGIGYVWLFLSERPSNDFLIGATIVLISITANSLYQSRVHRALDNQGE